MMKSDGMTELLFTGRLVGLRVSSRAVTTRAWGALRVGWVAGESAVLESRSEAPIRLLTPRAVGPAVWGYVASYGGGMVAGDHFGVRVRVDAGASCFLGTQASTKVYRDPDRQGTSQRLEAWVGRGALLVQVPDPVQCFESACYEQEQEVEVEDGGSLVSLDAVSGGRAACGERWAVAGYRSLTRIRMGGRLVFHDHLVLDPASGELTARHRLGGYQVFATLVMLGPAVEEAAAGVLERVGGWPVSRDADVLAVVSPLAGGGVVLRMAAGSTEVVWREVVRALGPLALRLGGNPLERRA